MKTVLQYVETLVKITLQLMVIVLFCQLAFMPEIRQKVRSTLANQDIKKIEIGKVKIELSDSLNTRERTANKQPSDIPVTANTKPAAEALNQLTTQQEPLSAKSPKDSFWVYLGVFQNNKWKSRVFQVDRVPVTGQYVTAVTDVFKRSDKARLEGSTWALGEIVGVVKEGEKVTVLNTVKVADEQDGQYWWAQVMSL